MHAKAISESEKQPKSLRNDHFASQRETDHYQQKMKYRKDSSHHVLAIGRLSLLHTSEVNSIVDMQKRSQRDKGGELRI